MSENRRTINPAEIRVLAVDDEEPIRSVLKTIMEGEGYLCETAANADEAIGRLKKNKYDIILTDIMMPGISGIELLDLVRERDDEIAVIMLTAVNDIDVSIRALKSGAYDYISKPFRPGDVLISVEMALQKRALILENRDYQRNLEKKVLEQSRKIQSSFIKSIEALARTLEAKDPETRDHSLRVTEYSIRTAEDMGLSHSEIEKIRVAAALHDIGKIGISDTILDKDESLRQEEREHIHSHPLIAAQILGPIDELKEIIQLIKYHHENFDGTGYPDGLAGEDIPIGSRIIAVADAFDAITSTRPYRKAKTELFAVAEIKKYAGRQFDPNVISHFLRAMGYQNIAASP